MTKKLLSIVVPTKDRYKYLKYLIQLVGHLDSDEVELVIQDNSDDNREILTYLNKNSFPFVRYGYHQGQIPMSENSDRAILNSTGEYVCFLGDDDGVTKFIIDGVKWMKSNNVDVIKPSEVYYIWPDATDAVRVNKVAVIYYKRFTGKVKFLNQYTELLKVLRGGIRDRGNMPLVYHGIASRRVLDNIYNQCGTYFPGNSPDISNAVALSLQEGKYALVDVPLVISGNSVLKGGGEGLPGRKFPPLVTDVVWFRNNAEKTWFDKLPSIAVGETIWVDSTISALRSLNRQDLIPLFDEYKFYARFLMIYPKLKNYIIPLIRKEYKLRLASFRFIILKYVSALLRRIGWLLDYKRPLYIINIDSILKAANELEKLSDGIIKK